MTVSRITSHRRVSALTIGAFNPARVANLFLWMDASDPQSVLLNGSNVAEWRSKAGALTAVQATASIQPAYTIAGQNGLNCLTFDGTGRRMVFNQGSASSSWSFLHDGTSQFAVFWVGSATSGQANTYVSNTRQFGSNDGNGFGINHDFGQIYGNPTIRAFSRSATGVIAQVDASLASGTVAAMELLGDLTNATAANRLRLRINQGSQSSSTAGAGTISTGAPQGPFSIGASGAGTLVALNGRICEIIIYRGAIAASESLAVRSYLMGKWGL